MGGIIDRIRDFLVGVLALQWTGGSFDVDGIHSICEKFLPMSKVFMVN